MNKIITDISDYIFVADKPQKVDVIFLPGGSFSELPEYAADLYQKGYARFLVPSGGMAGSEFESGCLYGRVPFGL